jgi:hypothetical protein
VVQTPSAQGALVWAVRRNGRDRAAEFLLEGCARVTTRLQEHRLLMADDRGSCRVADLVGRTWLRHIKV